MKTKTSVLKAIMDEVFTASTFEEAMAILNVRLDEPGSPIRDSDKRLIKLRAMQCEFLPKLQQYLANSYLKFSGLGVR